MNQPLVDWKGLAGSPLTGRLKGSLCLQGHLGDRTRIDLGGARGVFHNTVVVNQFDDPASGIAVDLKLNRISCEFHGKVISGEIP